MRVLTILLNVCFLASCSLAQSIFDNPEVEKEIDKLLTKMSIEEKVGQTCQITLDAVLKRDQKGNVLEPHQIDTPALKEALVKYHIGSILNVSSHTLNRQEWKYILNNIYSYYDKKESTIPVIYGIDAIHGVNYTVGATLFPQEIGLAATWNKELAKQFGEITAYETRASGIHWNFSPVLDLGRQPLWSRFFETLGEDPFMVSQMGSAIVEGYQGKNSIDGNHVAACLKHFVGYSNPQSGRDRTPAWIPAKMMKELYLPPFKEAVEKGALTLMINSGDVNAVPGHMNYELLTKTLKEEWGFKGFTVSDWEDFELLHAVHQTASDSYDAIIKAINAGVDMSMVPYSPQYKTYCSLFVKAVKEGKISESRLNDAVRRILRVKYLVGLFKKDRNQASDYNKFGSDEFKKIAENAALESITLLKNDKDILPLSTDKKVLIAGATSNDLIFLNGAWTHTWQGADNRFNTKGCKTIRAAFEEKLGKDNCIFTQACELYLENGFEKSKLNDIDKFIAEAAKVDVIVLCLGEFPATEKPGDIFSLNLSSEQLELAKIAYTTGKPVILVLTEARPRIIREIEEKASAIINCYLPGDYGADALVKLIYGETDFSGRLPFTYPRYDGVIEFYDHPKSVDKAKSGAFDAYNPQWNFGFGLSYNKVDYSELKLTKSSINTADSLKISVNIKNTGKNSTREVVQLYLSDLQASIVPAGKKLVDFKKIELKAGEQKTVDFTITQNSLKFADTSGNFVTEKGKFKVSIGKLFAEFNLE